MKKSNNPFIKHFKPFVKNKQFGAPEKITLPTGEVVTHLLFRKIEFDGEAHIKIFIEVAGVILDLTPAGLKVFMMLVYSYEDKNSDVIYYHYNNTIEYWAQGSIKKAKIGRTTYYKGIGELLRKNVIAKHDEMDFCYYVNYNFFYRGDRFAAITCYDKTTV